VRHLCHSFVLWCEEIYIKHKETPIPKYSLNSIIEYKEAQNKKRIYPTNTKENNMNPIEKFKKALHNYTNFVEQDILSDNFEVIKPIGITATIIVRGIEIDIWVSNEPQYTRMYRLRYEDVEMCPEMYFKHPHEVRNIIISKNTIDTSEEHY